MGWIDTTVITVIIIVGLMIMYKALKEPLDHLGRLIAGLFGWGADKLSGTEGYTEMISYG